MELPVAIFSTLKPSVQLIDLGRFLWVHRPFPAEIK